MNPDGKLMSFTIKAKGIDKKKTRTFTNGIEYL